MTCIVLLDTSLFIAVLMAFPCAALVACIVVGMMPPLFVVFVILSLSALLLRLF